MVKYTYWHEILENHFSKKDLDYLYKWNKLSNTSGFYNLFIPMEEIEKLCKKVEVKFNLDDYVYLDNSYGCYIKDIKELLEELKLDFDLTYISSEEYNCFYYIDISTEESRNNLKKIIQEKIKESERLKLDKLIEEIKLNEESLRIKGVEVLWK